MSPEEVAERMAEEMAETFELRHEERRAAGQRTSRRPMLHPDWEALSTGGQAHTWHRSLEDGTQLLVVKADGRWWWTHHRGSTIYNSGDRSSARSARGAADRSLGHRPRGAHRSLTGTLPATDPEGDPA